MTNTNNQRTTQDVNDTAHVAYCLRHITTRLEYSLGLKTIPKSVRANLNQALQFCDEAINRNQEVHERIGASVTKVLEEMTSVK